MSEKTLYGHEQDRRDHLRKKKPLVYEKIIRYPEKITRGESTAIIDLAYDFICNLKCKHCCASKMAKKEQVLTVEDIRNLALQADEYGLAQFNISGGEPLLFKELDEIINALIPERFHLSMSTNGMFLDYERAKHLADIGLDKVKISVDSIDEAMHNSNRNKEGAYKKAIEALHCAKDAGLQVVMQHVVTHQTAKSKELELLCEYAEKHGFAIDAMVARTLGEWEGNNDVLIDEEDASALRALHEKYPFFSRDVFPHYGVMQGCGAVDRTLHITKYGDVLPCVFIQIAIGNIFENSLKEIIDRGFNIKYFREYSQLCLSGEDRHFINKYMARCQGKPIPANHYEIFDAEDYIIRTE